MSPLSHATVREIAHDSPEYHAARRARERILREPLGLRLSEEDVRDEARQRHFIIESDGALLGSVIARAEAPKTVRLRQMWIEPDHAGQGIGRQLLERVIAILAAEGIENLVLHARQPVLDFYRKCGFTAGGPEFTEVGIPHHRMKRGLNPERRSPGDRR